MPELTPAKNFTTKFNDKIECSESESLCDHDRFSDCLFFNFPDYFNMYCNTYKFMYSH